MMSFTRKETAEIERREEEALAPGFVRTKFGTITEEEAAEREARAIAKRAEHEANRTDPDYWVRKAEGALHFGQPAKVGGFLALARYYRDGEGKP